MSWGCSVATALCRCIPWGSASRCCWHRVRMLQTPTANILDSKITCSFTNLQYVKVAAYPSARARIENSIFLATAGIGFPRPQLQLLAFHFYRAIMHHSWILLACNTTYYKYSIQIACLHHFALVLI